MRGPSKRSLLNTFNEHWIEDPVTGCHIWQRARNNKGYGVLYARGRTRCASRVSYERRHGILPSKVFVLHKCDNPACVNPDHLFAGSQKDNMQDCKSKGRVGFIAHHGAANWMSKKVSLGDVQELLKTGITQTQAASKLNISRATLQRVVYGKHWCNQNAADAGAAQAGGD